MDLDLLRTFVAFVDHGGVLAAARALRISKQAVSSRLARLEAIAEVELLQRDRRPVVATDGGRVFAERCRRIVLAADDALLDLRRRAESVVGTLRIATPALFGRLYLPRVLDVLAREAPGLRVEADVIDSPDPSVPWTWDAVIWIGPLPDVHWIAHPLFEARNHLCAAPGLDERRLIRAPADLTRVRTVHYRRRPGPARWPLTRGAEAVTVSLTPWLETNDVELALRAVCAGHGVGHLPWVLAEPLLADGRLVAVLPDWRAAFGRVVALYRTPRHRLPRLHVFLDALDGAVAAVNADPGRAGPTPEMTS